MILCRRIGRPDRVSDEVRPGDEGGVVELLGRETAGKSPVEEALFNRFAHRRNRGVYRRISSQTPYVAEVIQTSIMQGRAVPDLARGIIDDRLVEYVIQSLLVGGPLRHSRSIVPMVPDIRVDEVLYEVMPLPAIPPRRLHNPVDVGVPYCIRDVVRRIAKRVRLQETLYCWVSRIRRAHIEEFRCEAAGLHIVKEVPPVPVLFVVVHLPSRKEDTP